MPKIETKAFRLRLDYEAKAGHSVSQKEIAKLSGIDRLTLRRIERGETKGIDFDTLAKLCAFYGVGVGEILEYNPDDTLSPSRVAELTFSATGA